MIADSTIIQQSAITVPRLLFQRIMLCFTAFMLVFCNGRPYVLSSGFYCLLVIGMIFLFVCVSKKRRMNLPKDQLVTAVCLVGLVVTATISTCIYCDSTTVINLFWGFYVPLFLYFTFVGIELNEKDIRSILIFLALAVLLRFSYGLLIFYSEWGIALSMEQLLSARFDIARMESYRQATFGNTGNSASILAILFPVFLAGLARLKMPAPSRIILIAGIIILMINLLITGSRSALLMVTFMTPLTLFVLGSPWRYMSIVAVLLFSGIFFFNAGETHIQRLAAAIKVDKVNDNAVFERADSIYYGIQILKEHPLGVGPGMSYLYNPYEVAHQFLISQGSELGWLGMLFLIVIFAHIGYKTLLLWSLPRKAKPPSAIFCFGLFTWVAYAMIANIPVNSGATIPWIGLFIFFLSISKSKNRGTGT